jgi:hypothetical protein
MLVMNDTILYGYSYTDEETNHIYVTVYRGLYDIKSTNSHKRYNAVRHIIGMNLTRRLIWKGRKHPQKVTEIGDGFLQIGDYTTCREINSVFTSLGYSPEEITELLTIIVSKSDDPALKSNGSAVSF